MNEEDYTTLEIKVHKEDKGLMDLYFNRPTTGKVMSCKTPEGNFITISEADSKEVQEFTVAKFFEEIMYDGSYNDAVAKFEEIMEKIENGEI